MKIYKIIILLNLIHCICYAGPQEDSALIMATASGNIELVDNLLETFANGSPNTFTITRCIDIALTNQEHDQIFGRPFNRTNALILGTLKEALSYYKMLEDKSRLEKIINNKENLEEYRDIIFGCEED